MDKLQRKCFTGALVGHGLLVAALIFGAAFLSSQEPPQEMPTVFSFTKLTDANVRTGSPNVDNPAPSPVIKPTPTPPTPTPPTPTPPPPHEPEVKQVPPPKSEPKQVERTKPPKASAKRHPEPDDTEADKAETPVAKPVKPLITAKSPTGKIKESKETEKNSKSSTASKPTTAPPHRAPEVDLGHVVTHTNDAAAVAAKRQAEAEAAAAAAEREEKRRADLAKLFGSAAADITKHAAGSTEVYMPQGAGTEYAKYSTVIYSIYKQRFDTELDAHGAFATANARVQVAITISKDGKVQKREVVKPSGNTTLDGIVRKVLRSVDFIAPFPPESKDAERTFDLYFDLKPNNRQA